METHTVELTGHLARAARALVGTSASHTAGVAKLTKSQLRDFEKSIGMLDEDQLASLQAALEQLGAIFIADGEQKRGHGVRLKFSADKVEKIEAWEDEGGLPADDDV